MSDVSKTPAAPPSPWSPLRVPAFAVLWAATVVSNIGTWMHDVGAGWLMTELSPSPFVVAAVQAATTLPVFLFALPAGALADIVDRRRLLIVVNLFMGVTAGILALLVHFEQVTPVVLLLVTLAMGTGAAFMAPAWQAIVPQLVPRTRLSAAVALNSMGINVSRAIGPALAGVLIVGFGLAMPFVLNAISVIAIVGALIWWRPMAEARSTLPREHMGGAMVAGLRYAANSVPLRMTLLRAAAFFVFASALWALLPLVARSVLLGGPTLYGVLLGCLGFGAVIGALVLPSVKQRLGPGGTVAAGTAGTAATLVLFALVANPVMAAFAAALAGLSWIAVLSTLHVSAQTALPAWVRARGLSIFLTVFFGAMSGGSLMWGQVAAMIGIPSTLIIAAIGAVALVPVTWRAKLGLGADLDLAPSGHWPEPVVAGSLEGARGPVMIQIDYDVAAPNRRAFETAMEKLAVARRRNGAYGWVLMQDVSAQQHYRETWFETSWVHHLRHHERVSAADRDVQDEVSALHCGGDPPVVTHFLPPHTSVTEHKE